MAPRKKTEEKASANEAADMVLLYLREVFFVSYTYTHMQHTIHLVFHTNIVCVGKQNRPYSAIDVSANLHNKVTKGAFRDAPLDAVQADG